MLQDDAPKALMTQPGVLQDMVQELGPVASNHMCKHLGVPMRVLPSPTAPLSTLQMVAAGACDLASTVGVLGPISELDSEDSPDKGESPGHVAFRREPQRASAYDALDPQVAALNPNPCALRHTPETPRPARPAGGGGPSLNPKASALSSAP